MKPRERKRVQEDTQQVSRAATRLAQQVIALLSVILDQLSERRFGWEESCELRDRLLTVATDTNLETCQWQFDVSDADEEDSDDARKRRRSSEQHEEAAGIEGGPPFLQPIAGTSSPQATSPRPSPDPATATSSGSASLPSTKRKRVISRS